MNRWDETRIHNHIRGAVADMTPDQADAIWEQPAAPAEADAWFLDGTRKKAGAFAGYAKWIGVAAACFLLVAIGWFRLYRFADAVVYLDVNPSIGLEVNHGGRVIEAVANNDDGRIVLEDMNLKHVDVDVAINALLGSMIKHGYLTKTQNVLLVSVEGRDHARTDELRQTLSQEAELTLNMLLGDGVVLDQSIESNQGISDLSAQYGITPGKAALISHLVEVEPDWQISELAGMTISELMIRCMEAGIEISSLLEVTGTLPALEPSGTPSPAGTSDNAPQQDDGRDEDDPDDDPDDDDDYDDDDQDDDDDYDDDDQDDDDD